MKEVRPSEPPTTPPPFWPGLGPAIQTQILITSARCWLCGVGTQRITSFLAVSRWSCEKGALGPSPNSLYWESPPSLVIRAFHSPSRPPISINKPSGRPVFGNPSG